MSDKDCVGNLNSGGKKRQRKKREASSPLNDNFYSVLDLSGKESVNIVNTGERKKVKTIKNKKDNTQSKQSKNKSNCKSSGQDDNNSQPSQQTPVTLVPPVTNFPVDVIPDHSFYYNMYSQGQGLPQTPFMQGSPPVAFPNAFGLQASTPPWAAKLLDDVEQIKQKIQSIDKIEKTVNIINSKVSVLETKMADLDTRLTQNETSCEFISSINDENTKELKSTKEDLSKLQKSCKGLQTDAKTLRQKHEEIDSKLIDLEARSMRDNLMFYGIREGGTPENCEMLVKELCDKTLGMHTAHELKFDRVHRVGPKSATKTRPIVAKFHYYEQREQVRKLSFDASDALKAANLGVGAQIPKEIRDARKPLYPAMKQAKDAGKNVKFVGKKLLIDGAEYKLPAGVSASQSETGGHNGMEH